MSLTNRARRTKNLVMKLRSGDTDKQAGSNHFQLIVNSDSWRIQDQAVSMTLRDAQALKNFLNENLPD